MNEIFISYRHEDSYSDTGRLYAELTRYFGNETVFLDQSDIQSGEDFPEKLREAIDAAEVFLVVIGASWRNAFNSRNGTHSVDYVREEIAFALKRRELEGEAKIKVIPVLLHQETLPVNADDLPEAIRELAVLNAHSLRDGVADYESDVMALRTLISRHCGNLLARRQNSWLMCSLKDKNQSKADIGPDISVLADPAQFVPRSHIDEALGNWWETWPANRKPFVLLGDEGDGKSWAVSAWLAGKMQNGLGVPVVYTSATRAAHADIESILADALDKSLPTFSEQGWKRILSGFCNAEMATNPRFILVLDGLNERPSEGWERSLQQCLVSPWRDCLAVIVICRSVYWNRCLEAFNDEVELTTLPPYNDAELRDALQRAGRKQDLFSLDVQKVMSKPRSFKLALRLSAEVEHGGLTLERLIYEDWRDMSQNAFGGKLPSHEDFQAFLRELVEKNSVRFDHSDFAKIALGFGDPQLLKSQLLDANILVKDGGRLLLHVNPMLLAFGLLLACEVEEHVGQGELAMREAIDRRMGDHQDMDQRVRICGLALFHALSIREYPDAGRSALLHAWIDGRNFDQDTLDGITAYLPLHPQTYLRMAEEVWGRADNREVQDVFMRGFLRYRTQPKVREKLVESFTSWLGFVYLNGYRGYFEREPEKLAESKRVVENLLGESPAPGDVLNRFGCELVAMNNQGLMRLGQVAVAVISHETDRRPYCRALVTGMMVNAAMEGGWPEFYWVCRTSDQRTQTELMQAAQSLIEQQQPLAYATARVILNAIGSDVARNIRETIPAEYRPEHFSVQYFREHRCDGVWEADNYLDCLQAQQWNPVQIAGQLQKLAVQPGIYLPDTVITQLHNTGDWLDLGNVEAAMGSSRENIILEEIEPALCAFYPERYAKLMCNLSAELAVRDGLSRRRLAGFLYDHLPVLDETARQTIESAWQAAMSGDGEEDRWAELMLFACLVFDRSEAEQLQFALRRPVYRGYWRGHEPCLRSFSVEQLFIFEQSLDEAEPERLHDVLECFSETLPQLNTALRNHLLAIFQEGNSDIRGLCLKVFFHAKDEQAAYAVIESCWQAPSKNEERLEAGYGSLLLARYSDAMSFDELVQRISPGWLGYALEQRGCKANEVVEYVSLLNAIWLQITGIGISPDMGGRIVTVKVERNSEPAFERIAVRPYESGSTKFINYTWGGSAGAGSIDQLKQSFNHDAMRQEQTLASRAVLEKIEAMRVAGNPWFVFSFSHGNLDKVVALSDAPWRPWVAAAMEGGGERIIALCRAFYEKLCAALLVHEPETGASLFRVLRAHDTIRLNDNDTRLSVLLIDLFATRNSEPVAELRDSILNDCSTDMALFEVVLLSSQGGDEAWLNQKIEVMRNSNWDYDRARAWMLEGYSLSLEAHERLQEFVAGSENSWVRDIATISLQNQKRNTYARHWFERFLTENDRVKAWAAFRLFLRCVDRRFWLWLPNMPLKNAELWKRDALKANYAEICTMTEKNEKGWQDTLVGHKIQSDQLWPWMKNYAIEM